MFTAKVPPRWGARAGALLGTLTVQALAAASLGAQATIQGRVTDLATGEPIFGAVVSVVGAGQSVETGPAGIYELASVDAGTLSFRADATGYVSVMDTVWVPQQGLRVVHFRLATVAATLDELLVTAGREGDRSQGETVSRVRSQRGSTAGTAHEMMDGQVPGATILRSSGQVGSGHRILLRGVSSLTGSNAPAVYLDGIRLSSGYRDALLSNLGSPGAIDFLDVASIDRIEVIKGAAAAARYGPDTANGVILIYTRGR